MSERQVSWRKWMGLCIAVAGVSFSGDAWGQEGEEVRVTNVVARQRYPWNTLVDIAYEMTGEISGGGTYIEASGYDQDANTGFPLWSLSGDGIDGDVHSGKNLMVWDAEKDRQGFMSSSCAFNVSSYADDPLFLIVDLRGGTNVQNFGVSMTNGVPRGGWDEEYKTDKLVLRRLEAGMFRMGSSTNDSFWWWSDETAHEVFLDEPYYIGVFEVTRKQYELVTGIRMTNDDATDATFPVEWVSYDDIRGQKNGVNWPGSASVDPGSFMGILRAKTGLKFDLPTEAQWEHACRATSTTALNSGKNLWGYEFEGEEPNMDELGTYTWGREEWNPVTHQFYNNTHYGWSFPVGSLKPNAWGLYDMHGNAREWCADWYGEYPDHSVTNPIGADVGEMRVMRGGGASDYAVQCRSACRDRCRPDAAWGGFRVACATGDSVLFEEIGSCAWTESVKVSACVGTEGWYEGWRDNATFAVAAGPGSISNGVLTFSGIGDVCLAFTARNGNGETMAAMTQTVAVTKAEAKLSLVGRQIFQEGDEVSVMGAVVSPEGLNVTVTYDGVPTPSSEVGMHTVRAEVTGEEWYHGSAECSQVVVEQGDYLVVDLSSGTSGTTYPISHLEGVPDGGWSEEYKTGKLVLRRVDAGTYPMGAPNGELGRDTNEVLHAVTLSKPFYVGIFEITQKQYELVTGKTPSMFKGNDRPVEYVTYSDIRGKGSGTNWPTVNQVSSDSFLGKLRAKTGLTFDLPTEAQWEYACRAGTTSALNSGLDLASVEQSPRMDELGRYRHNWADGRGGYTNNHTTVGSYLPNTWGLYDMHGNVFEWCLDWFGNLSGESATDPVGAASGTMRVGRGGCWGSESKDCRSASRGQHEPNVYHWAVKSVGCRLVCTVDDPLP